MTIQVWLAINKLVGFEISEVEDLIACYVGACVKMEEGEKEQRRYYLMGISLGDLESIKFILKNISNFNFNFYEFCAAHLLGLS